MVVSVAKATMEGMNPFLEIKNCFRIALDLLNLKFICDV